MTSSIACAALALGLTACSGAPASPASAAASSNPSLASQPSAASASASSTPAPTAHPAVKASNSLAGITVTEVAPTPAPTAAAGQTAAPAAKVPAITFKAPYAVDQTRSQVIKAGTGATVAATSTVTLNYVGVNGYDGKTFDSSYARGEAATFPLDQVVPGFAKGLTGHKVGDRVLIAIPGKDGYDASGGSPRAGILVGDTLLFVVDILDIDYQTPFGQAVTPPAGLPAVGKDAKGLPTLTINTAATPPAAVTSQPLINGAGQAKVKTGDTLVVHYRTWSWKTGQMIEDQFAQPNTGALADVIGCWREGLVGKAAGSRVMLVCPPASAFPAGQTASPSIAAGDTLVYVVDIVSTGTGQ